MLQTEVEEIGTADIVNALQRQGKLKRKLLPDGLADAATAPKKQAIDRRSLGMATDGDVSPDADTNEANEAKSLKSHAEATAKMSGAKARVNLAGGDTPASPCNLLIPAEILVASGIIPRDEVRLVADRGQILIKKTGDFTPWQIPGCSAGYHPDSMVARLIRLQHAHDHPEEAEAEDDKSEDMEQE